jgi:hypothetical protein
VASFLWKLCARQRGKSDPALLAGEATLRTSRYAFALSANEPEVWPAETLENADLIALLAHWEKLRGARADGKIPLRMVASGDIGRLLKYVHLCDVVNGGEDFRWRIIGSAVFPGLVSPVGKFVSEHPDMGVKLRYPTLMSAVVQSLRPVRGTATRVCEHATYNLESIWLPFGNIEVRQVLGMVSFKA